jgi:hypothetical protein
VVALEVVFPEPTYWRLVLNTAAVTALLEPPSEQEAAVVTGSSSGQDAAGWIGGRTDACERIANGALAKDDEQGGWNTELYSQDGFCWS